MLARCYDKNTQKTRPNYSECSVRCDWLIFSNFKDWMAKQDWRGNHLDKDLLFVGNKVYSPETCVFVSALTNTFTEDRANYRGNYPLGVCFDKRRKNFYSRCSNPFTGSVEFLGIFNCETEAHLAWKKRKHELSCQLADLQTDQRVAEALRHRYLHSRKNQTIFDLLIAHQLSQISCATP
jgi:hypothetical protein